MKNQLRPALAGHDTQNIFEKIAQSVFALPPIMLGMFGIMAYLIFESQALLYHIFPDSLTGYPRLLSAWLLAIAIHLTILTTAANAKLVPKSYPVFFAIASYLITALFFDAWDIKGKSFKVIFTANMFSALIAAINYLFVFLFINKWQELKGNQSATEQLQQANQTVSKLEADLTSLQQTFTTTKQQLTNAEQQLTSSNQSLTKLQQDYSNLQQSTQVSLTKLSSEHTKELQMIEEKRMCGICKHVSDTYQGLNRFKRDCTHAGCSSNQGKMIGPTATALNGKAKQMSSP